MMFLFSPENNGNSAKERLPLPLDNSCSVWQEGYSSEKGGLEFEPSKVFQFLGFDEADLIFYYSSQQWSITLVHGLYGITP